MTESKNLGRIEISDSELLPLDDSAGRRDAKTVSDKKLITTDQTAVLATLKKTPGFDANKALLAAVKNNNLSLAKLLISQEKADPLYTFPVSDKVPGGSHQASTAMGLAMKLGHLELVKLFFPKCNKPASLERISKYAVRSGYVTIVEFLKHQGVKFAHSYSFNGIESTVVACAAISGSPELVDYFIKLGEPVGLALSEAASRGHLEVVKVLLAARTPTTTQSDGDKTALHLAVREGHDPIAKELLETGADPLAKDSKKQTPLLIVALRSNPNLDLLNLLIQKAAQKTSNHPEIVIALKSIFSKHYKICLNNYPQSLAAQKAFKTCTYVSDKVASLSLDKITPLRQLQIAQMAACMGDQDRLLKILEAKEITPTTVGESGETLLSLAALGGNESIFKHLVDLAPTALSIAAKDGWLPIHRAATNGKAEIVIAILKIYPQCLNVVTKHGNTPLHLAADGAHSGVIKTLIEQKAEIRKNKDGDNPLHLAVKKGDLSSLKELLKHPLAAKIILEKNKVGHDVLTEALLAYNNNKNTSKDADFLGIFKELKKIGVEPTSDLCKKAGLTVTKIEAIEKYLAEFSLELEPLENKESKEKGHPSPLPISVAVIKDLPTLFEAISKEKEGKDAKANRGNTQAIIQYIEANQQLIATEIKSAVSRDGLTLVQQAAISGSAEVLQTLLAIAPADLTVVAEFKKPHPTIPDADGASLLHLAVVGNNIGVIHFLGIPENFEKLSHLKNKSNRTAMEFAKHTDKTEALQILQFYDAQEFIADKKREPGFDPNRYLAEAISAGNGPKTSLLLAEEKANINAKLPGNSDDPRCLLSLAASKGNLEMVKLLLERKAEVVSVKKLPLHAVNGGNVEIIKLLERKGVKFFRTKDDDGNSSLHWAAAKGHPAVVEYLIQSDKRAVNNGNADGDTPLHVAVENGHIEVMEALLNAGASASVKNMSEKTPLQVAIRDFKRDKIIKLLIDNRCKEGNKSKLADELAKNFSQHQQNFWDTEIFKEDCYQMSKIILDELKKIKPTSVTETMEIQLAAMAAASDDIIEVRKILENKIDRNINHPINSRGTTIVHVAASWATNSKIIDCIVEQKGNVNGKDNSGNTPALYAVEVGNLEALKALVGHKANLNLYDKEGNTPFHLAVVRGQFEIVSFLLELDKSNRFLNAAAKSRAFKVVMKLYAKASGSKEEKLLEVIKLLAKFSYESDGFHLSGKFEMQSGKIEIIKNELNKLEKLAKAKKEKEISDKLTASLLESIDSKNVEGVKEAIKAGADVNLKNAAGHTLLALVFLKMNEVYKPDEKGAITPESKKELRELLKIARILLGAGVTEVNYLNLTHPILRRQVQVQLDAQERLWQGIKDGEPEQVKKAISNGADANRADEKDGYPLLSAVKNGDGNVEVVQCLVDAKADLTLLDKDGQTALHWVASQGNQGIVACLLVAGNNPNVVNKEGRTPLDLVFIEMNRCFKSDKKDSTSSEESADQARRTKLLAIAKDLINKGATPNYELLTAGILRDRVKARIESSNFSGPSAFFSTKRMESPPPSATPDMSLPVNKTKGLQIASSSPT